METANGSWQVYCGQLWWTNWPTLILSFVCCPNFSVAIFCLFELFPATGATTNNKQSGTGKTAVFSMGILQMLDTSSSDTQALVLSPTRELAEQTQKVPKSTTSNLRRYVLYQYMTFFFSGLCILRFFFLSPTRQLAKQTHKVESRELESAACTVAWPMVSTWLGLGITS